MRVSPTLSSSSDSALTKDLIAAIGDKWGHDSTNWVPSQSDLQHEDPDDWPRRLLKALGALAARTHTDEDRDYVIDRLRQNILEAMGRDRMTYGPSLTKEQLADQLAWDAEILLTKLAPAFDLVDELVMHWDEEVESWLPLDAIPHPSALAWDIKLLGLMADFATTYPGASHFMRKRFVEEAMKGRTEKTAGASAKITAKHWKEATSYYEHAEKEGSLQDLEEALKSPALPVQDVAKALETKRKTSKTYKDSLVDDIIHSIVTGKRAPRKIDFKNSAIDAKDSTIDSKDKTTDTFDPGKKPQLSQAPKARTGHKRVRSSDGDAAEIKPNKAPRTSSGGRRGSGGALRRSRSMPAPKKGT